MRKEVRTGAAGAAGAARGALLLLLLLLARPSLSARGSNPRPRADAAAAVLADIADLQREMLAGAGLDDKRVVLCKTVAGLGNRIQGIVSCLALAVATRRALVVQWDREVSTAPPLANGLMPCRLEDVLAFPAGLDLNVSRAFADPGAAQGRVVEAYVSQMVLQSGKSPSWGDLLLCTNLTFTLKRTPVLSVPAWRWMPEILSNEAYRSALGQLFGAAPGGAGVPDPPAFFRTVAPSLLRPAHALEVAAAALRRYWPPDSRAVGLQVRLGLETDNEDEAAHFFTPCGMWRSWLRCAYSALGGASEHRDEAGAREVWFVAADSADAKVDLMMQMRREEGAVVAALNLEHVTSKAQRESLLRPAGEDRRAARAGHAARGAVDSLPATGHAWLDEHVLPVVVDFASGTRLVFFGRKASRIACEDVQSAMLEMHVLSWSGLLVASHLSTFAALPAASVPAAGLHHVNRDGDCFPALSLEPLSDAGDLFRETAQCFSERHVLQHAWTRPRRRSARRRGQDRS